MAVKIIIKRIVPEDNIKYLTALLKQLRSIDNWKDWENSKERAEIQEKIDLLLGEATKYEIYHYG